MLPLFLAVLLLSGCLSLPTGQDSVVIEPVPTPYRSAAPMEDLPPPMAPVKATPRPSEAPSEDVTPEPSETPANPGSQPPLLTQALEESGLTFDNLTGRQLVMVYMRGRTTQIYCYEKGEDGWQLRREISYLRAYVGRNGLNRDKVEGDGTTPSGLYPLVFAFGHEAEADTRMEYRQITEGTYWVNDPDSALYNQWTQQKGEGLWAYAEDLFGTGVRYNIAFVVGYNYGENMIPGKGSGIFLHCGDYATDGGISMKEVNMRKLAAWLDQKENPQILIAGGQ